MPADRSPSCATLLRSSLIPLFMFLIASPASKTAIAQEIVPKPFSQDQPPLKSAKDSRLTQAVLARLDWPEPQPPFPDLPAQVAIPANQRIPVDLETPLTSGVSKQAEKVTFRTVYSLLLDGGLEIPPGTEIQGHVVAVKRVNHFGKGGELRLAVDQMQLDPGHAANLEARLEATELMERLRFRAVTPVSPTVNTVPAVATGDAGVSATGANKNAGSEGEAAGVLTLTSLRGQDVYLEQGMRFTIILDQPAILSGSAVYAAQQDFLKHSGSSTLPPDSHNRTSPELKRRLGRN